jgi:rhamnopyranosyl-N-acetylglucosaminyl-diphospho-decaprenol beta-1,3/1,4-galactofuranosyltransferase
LGGNAALEVSVASITTAYNAIRILPRHIDALLRQSRPLQQIVIVDNGSNDGTGEMLAEKYPQVTVLRLEKNVGAAGGWAAGLKYAALEKRHDWIWNFDDDSVPPPDALELLLAGEQEISDTAKLGMMAPLPVHIESGTLYPPLFWRDGFVKPSGETIRQPIWFADLVIASGCMVRRSVVEQIGLPRADFFMDFFDFEYCLRARAQGLAIAVVTACKFSHEIGNARPVRLAGFHWLWTDYAPWREYYLARNIVYAANSLFPSVRTRVFVAKHWLRHATGVVLFGRRKFKSLQRMLQGAVDGIRGRLGIRFLPG